MAMELVVGNQCQVVVADEIQHPVVEQRVQGQAVGIQFLVEAVDTASLAADILAAEIVHLAIDIAAAEVHQNLMQQEQQARHTLVVEHHTPVAVGYRRPVAVDTVVVAVVVELAQLQQGPHHQTEMAVEQHLVEELPCKGDIA